MQPEFGASNKQVLVFVGAVDETHPFATVVA